LSSVQGAITVSGVFRMCERTIPEVWETEVLQCGLGAKPR